MIVGDEVQYQLVVQLRSSARDALDKMLRLEDRLGTLLEGLGTVDGHDVGVDEVNLFILTSHPIRVFDRMLVIAEASTLLPNLRIAYRVVGTDEFRTLHPPGQYKFEVT